MAEPFLFFTELVGLKVFDLKGRKLGVVRTRPSSLWSTPFASIVS